MTGSGMIRRAGPGPAMVLAWVLALALATSAGRADGPAPLAREERRAALAAIHQARAQLPPAANPEGPGLDPGLRRRVADLRNSFPELPAGRGDQVRFARFLLGADGGSFDAIRFRTPATGEPFRLLCEVVVPGTAESRNVRSWNILPATGDDGPALGADSTPLDDCDARGVGLPSPNFAVSSLAGPLAPAAEYILWFDLKGPDATPAFVKLRLDPIGPPAPPRTPSLVKARAAYEAARGGIDRKYDADRAALGRAYAADLAKGAAAAAPDPADAPRVAAEADELRRGEAATRGHRGFRILRAGFGVDSRWVDVTKQLRGMVRGDVLRFAHRWDVLKPDPALNVRKTLMVVYALDGNVRASITREGDLVELPPVPAAGDRLDAGAGRPRGEPADPPPPPAAPALQAARATFQAGLGTLADRYDGEIKAIRRVYLTELDKVDQLPATRRDRAEADRIAAEVDRLNGGDSDVGSPRGFRIVRAEYGEGGRWNDVTVPIRSLIRGSTLVYDPSDMAKYGFKPDPSLGVVKYLLVVFTVDGVPAVSMTADDRRLELPRRAGGRR